MSMPLLKFIKRSLNKNTISRVILFTCYCEKLVWHGMTKLTSAVKNNINYF